MQIAVLFTLRVATNHQPSFYVQERSLLTITALHWIVETL